MRTLELVEYVPFELEANALSEDEAGAVLERYPGRMALEYPTPPTGRRWRLRSEGWVGTFPVTPELQLRVAPKVPLANLFGMWEYAYRLKGFQILAGLDQSESVEGFYTQLARVLAGKVLDRERRGLAREYVGQQDRLGFIAGRMDLADLARRPWEVARECHIHEHTADVDDNRLLAWTLSLIARNALCGEHAAPAVRRAYRVLRNAATLEPFTPRACVGRLYTRLTQDYEPMHLLCRFFLEHSGPTHRAGDASSLPFMVDMAGLFELFVAEWLRQHLPPALTVKAQERVNITARGEIHYNIDLVLYDAATGEARCVLDTKYKRDADPSNADLNQAVVYANLKGCRTAVLIYPTAEVRPRRLSYRQIDVHTLAFDLSDDLEAAGARFMAELLGLLTG